MKSLKIILMMITLNFIESSFGAAEHEKIDGLGRVAALRLALPHVNIPCGVKRREPSPEADSLPELKRVRSAPGSGEKREQKKPRTERKLQDILNLFHDLEKKGSPEKGKLLDQLDGLPPSHPKLNKGFKGNLSEKFV